MVRLAIFILTFSGFSHSQDVIDINPEAEFGTLRVSSDRKVGGFVELLLFARDGSPTMIKPNQNYNLHPGKYRVEVYNPDSGYFWNYEVQIRENQLTEEKLAHLKFKWDPNLTKVDLGPRAKAEITSSNSNFRLLVDLDLTPGRQEDVSSRQALVKGTWGLKRPIKVSYWVDSRPSYKHAEPKSFEVQKSSVRLEISPPDLRSEIVLTPEPPAKGYELISKDAQLEYRPGSKLLNTEYAYLQGPERFRVFPIDREKESYALKVNGARMRIEVDKSGQRIEIPISVVNVHPTNGRQVGSFELSQGGHKILSGSSGQSFWLIRAAESYLLESGAKDDLGERKRFRTTINTFAEEMRPQITPLRGPGSRCGGYF